MASRSSRLSSYFVRIDVLPEEALRVVMLALPVDSRARAACVCRGWRDLLVDASLWQVLDLTSAGVAAGRVTEDLVRGAVARAAGHLRVLSYCRPVVWRARRSLVAVIESDGAELQQVITDTFLSIGELKRVSAAAPRLQVLSAGVSGECAELLPCLRNDPPYGPLRISAVQVLPGRPVSAHGDVLALAAAMAAHESLKGAKLSMDRTFAPGLNAVLDAAAKQRFTWLCLDEYVDTDAETVPALARLLQRGSLTKLEVCCDGFPLASHASVLELCAALRACRALTHLTLFACPLERAHHRSVAAVLGAAAALPALCELSLRGWRVQNTAVFGLALAALLAANLPSLRSLRVPDCGLGDDGMAPIMFFLEANTHLRELDCGGNNLSEKFVRGCVAPARTALRGRGGTLRVR